MEIETCNFVEDQYKDITYESFLFESINKDKSVIFQRLINNMMWYVIYENKIVNWGQYRYDLMEWIKVNIFKE